MKKINVIIATYGVPRGSSDSCNEQSDDSRIRRSCTVLIFRTRPLSVTGIKPVFYSFYAMFTSATLRIDHDEKQIVLFFASALDDSVSTRCAISTTINASVVS